VAEACKAAGSSSVELHEMDASSKESVAALASAVEGKVPPARSPPWCTRAGCCRPPGRHLLESRNKWRKRLHRLRSKGRGRR